MRRVAILVTSATLLATAALPAAAITKTIYVPRTGCWVTVETSDVSIAANNHGVHARPYGETRVYGDC